MRLINAEEIIIRLPFTLPPYNMMLLRNSIMQGIQDTPTVDAEPVRHGHWIKPKSLTVSCICSVCGFKFNLYEDDILGYPYCANCGAKMDEEAENEQTD